MSVGIVLAGNAGPRHPNEGAGWLSRRSRSSRLDGWEGESVKAGKLFWKPACDSSGQFE